MEYSIFKLAFESGVHIGEDSLEDYSVSLRADTLFSALCIEALSVGGEELLARLVDAAKNDAFFISDAFPYIEDGFFLPKPIIRVQAGQEDDDSGTKKIFKRLKYIPLDMVDDYAKGEFAADTAEYIANIIDNKLGKASIHARAAVRTDDETLPYNVGVYRFKKNAGLYFIAVCDEENLSLLRELLKALSLSGIGGKRSSGLGRFATEEESALDYLRERLSGVFPAYMTLCTSLPGEDELESSLEGATYTLQRRSGFVFSETYSEEPLRKNDLYALSSGSIMRAKYSGGVYDVSNDGAHPVYRYAKPLFLGVDI